MTLDTFPLLFPPLYLYKPSCPVYVFKTFRRAFFLDETSLELNPTNIFKPNVVFLLV